MSRVGKKPIPVPEKTEIKYQEKLIRIKGAKGTLERYVHPDVDLEIKDNTIQVVIDSNNRKLRALQGLTRSLVANMVTGVNNGFERVLIINGIGYRAELSGKNVIFNLGYSNPINFELPEGISAKVDRTKVTLSGIDKDLLGKTAASIRKLRPPEPYKGKGVKYENERIQRKAGKTGTK